eukprot:3752272-Ditylum_brightwellii.AAC.1
MAADISATMELVDTFWSNSPYTAAALTCGFKASAADYVAQKRDFKKRQEALQEELEQEEEAQLLEIMLQTEEELYNSNNSNEISTAVVTTEETKEEKATTDLRRNAAFLFYGAIYQGIAQEYIYNHLYPVLFGTDISITSVLIKVSFDLLLQTTLLTLPIAYLSKAFIYKYGIQEAFRRYKDDILNHGLLLKYYSLWGPVQCLTFSVIPAHYRITFIACVSFFWLIILSSIASKARNVINEDEEDYDDVEECSLVDGMT